MTSIISIPAIAELDSLEPTQLAQWLHLALVGERTEQIQHHIGEPNPLPGLLRSNLNLLEHHTRASLDAIVLRYIQDMIGNPQSIWRKSPGHRLLLLVPPLLDNPTSRQQAVTLLLEIVRDTHWSRSADDGFTMHRRALQRLNALKHRQSEHFWRAQYHTTDRSNDGHIGYGMNLIGIQALFDWLGSIEPQERIEGILASLLPSLSAENSARELEQYMARLGMRTRMSKELRALAKRFGLNPSPIGPISSVLDWQLALETTIHNVAVDGAPDHVIDLIASAIDSEQDRALAQFNFEQSLVTVLHKWDRHKRDTRWSMIMLALIEKYPSKDTFEPLLGFFEYFIGIDGQPPAIVAHVFDALIAHQIMLSSSVRSRSDGLPVRYSKLLFAALKKRSLADHAFSALVRTTPLAELPYPTLIALRDGLASVRLVIKEISQAHGHSGWRLVAAQLFASQLSSRTPDSDAFLNAIYNADTQAIVGLSPHQLFIPSGFGSQLPNGQRGDLTFVPNLDMLTRQLVTETAAMGPPAKQFEKLANEIQRKGWRDDTSC